MFLSWQGYVSALLRPKPPWQTGMKAMLKQTLKPVYAFADRSVIVGVRPEHWEVVAAAMPIALEASATARSSCRCHVVFVSGPLE